MVCQVVSHLEVLVWVVDKEAWLLILMRFSKCSWANKWVVEAAVEVIHSQALWVEEDEGEAHEGQGEGVVVIHSQVSAAEVTPLLASTEVLVDEEDGVEVGEARPFSSICELSSIYTIIISNVLRSSSQNWEHGVLGFWGLGFRV